MEGGQAGSAFVHTNAIMLRHVSQPKSFEIITRLIGSPRQARCFEILQLLKGAGRFVVFSSGPVKVQTPPWASVI